MLLHMFNGYKPVTVITNLRDTSHYKDAGRDLCQAMKAQPPQNLMRAPKLELDKWNAEALSMANCSLFALDGDPFSPPYSKMKIPMRPTPGELSLIFNRNLIPQRLMYALFEFNKNWERRGSMSEEERFERYIQATVAKTEHDGLKPLGLKFSCSAAGFPVALFFSYPDPVEFVGMDYHWYALRQDNEGNPVWASKLSKDKVKVAGPDQLFDEARKQGYTDFAGYYERPYDWNQKAPG